MSGRSNIIQGDCAEVLASLPDNYADAIVTDPPYFLTNSSGSGFMGKEWDSLSPNTACVVACFKSMQLVCPSTAEVDIAVQPASTPRADNRSQRESARPAVMSSGAQLRTRSPSSASAPVLVITKAEALVLCNALCPSLTPVVQDLPEYAHFVGRTSLWPGLPNASIVQIAAATWLDEPGWLAAAITSSSLEPTSPNATEERIGHSFASKSTNAISTVVGIAGSTVDPKKSSAITSGRSELSQITQKIISSHFASCATAAFTDPVVATVQILAQSWTESWAREALRVLKPGGYALVFGAPRSFHRMACGLEDAGFEIRDTLAWMFGCLSEDTEILVDGRWEHYSKAIVGHRALCYDPAHDNFAWLPIEETVEYPYRDTAFRLLSDRTDQIVSRNHRCLVEQGGGYVFQYAETLECEARVPILENLRDVLAAVPLRDERAGDAEPLLRLGVHSASSAQETPSRSPQGSGSGLCSMWRGEVGAAGVATESGEALLLAALSRSGDLGADVGGACVQGTSGMDGGQPACLSAKDDGSAQSSMERRRDLLSQTRELLADQVRALPTRVPADGQERRICDGAPADRRKDDRPLSATPRGCPSPRSQSAEQPPQELEALRLEHGAQTVRGQGFATPDLVRVSPVFYEGRVWCVRVPTGAFVARRNGKVFVTGNSGFPKSLDVSKAIDKAAGVERAVIGPRRYADGTQGHWGVSDKYAQDTHTKSLTAGVAKNETAPGSAESRTWAGWGTALKPAWEPIIMARKPLEGTVAGNVLAHGTGAINVDGCRIGAGNETLVRAPGSVNPSESIGTFKTGVRSVVQNPQGRWPANLIHDGSEDVLARFPSAPGQLVAASANAPSPRTSGIYGAMKRGNGSACRADSGSAARFFYQAKTSTGERNYGCDDLPSASAGEMTGGRAEGSAGLNNPRAGAGRTGRLYSYEKVLYPSASWVNVVLARRLPAATARSLSMATGGSTIRDNEGRVWSMCWCGSPSTDLSQPAIQSIIATGSSWTTDPKISNSSPRPHTNGCIAAAFGVKALGGNPAGFVASSSPSAETTGTSAARAGRSTAGAGPATSIESWLTSEPENRGGVQLGNFASHPTVKPIRLMRWLCRLVCRPGGLIIDPFLGSGTTGIAAALEGADFIGIEREAQWVTLAETRIAAWIVREDGEQVTRP